jgi:hypothetical protein
MSETRLPPATSRKQPKRHQESAWDPEECSTLPTDDLDKGLLQQSRHRVLELANAQRKKAPGPVPFLTRLEPWQVSEAKEMLQAGFTLSQAAQMLYTDLPTMLKYTAFSK